MDEEAGVESRRSLGIDLGAGAEGVVVVRIEAGAGVWRGSCVCVRGCVSNVGLAGRELALEVEADSEDEGDSGPFIVMAGAGVAGTCLSVFISLSSGFSISCSCFSPSDRSAVFSESLAVSSFSLSAITSLYSGM